MSDEQEHITEETAVEQPAAQTPASEQVEAEKTPAPAKGRKSRKKAKAAPAPEPEPAIADAEVAASPEESPSAGAETPVAEEATIEEILGGDEEAAVASETVEPADEGTRNSLPQVVEAILFASQKPMSAKELISVFKGAADAVKEIPDAPARAFAKVKEPHLREAIEALEIACASPDRAYEVRESAAGWQLVTKPQYSPWLRQIFPEHRSARLSAPALETLAIIAYRQPITRADIEAVRGVAVDGVMQTLLDRGLIKIAGRADIPGRPLLYDTTQNFMEHFGLKNLDDLPNAAELRKISLPTAEPPPAETPANPETPVPAAAEAPAEISPETPAEQTAEASAEAAPEQPTEAAPEPVEEAPAEQSAEAPSEEAEAAAEQTAEPEPIIETPDSAVEISPEASDEEGRPEN